MRKFFNLFLLIAAMFFCFASTASADPITQGYYTFEILSSNEVKLLRYDNSSYTGEAHSVTIHTLRYNGKSYNITEIGPKAFLNSRKVTEVICTSNVLSVEEHAFAGIPVVELSRYIDSIADGAFSPPPSIGTCRVSELRFTNTPTSFVLDSNGALYNKDKTKLIYYPGDGAFTVPSTVTRIADYAFAHGNISPRSTVSSVTIPPSVKTIGNYAFYLCDDLATVNLSSGLTSIGNYTFYGTAFSSITLPNSVTEVGQYAFKHNYNLKTIKLPAALTQIGKYALSDCGITSIEIPNTVTQIGHGAFSSCKSLANATLPSNLQTISAFAFSNCDSFTEITIPDNVSTLGASAFYGCDKLTKVTLPKGISLLDEQLFYDCISLKDITIPDNVTALNPRAFKGCTALEKIIISKSITSIGSNAFDGCTALKSVTLPDTLKRIDASAFYNCSSLEKLELPESTTLLGISAFEGCSSLKSIVVPDGITALPNYLFRYCTSLNDVTLPTDMTTISIGAFIGCSSLASITIPENVSEIKNNAFYNCTALTDVYFNNTADVWNTVTIGTSNDPLLAATMHYRIGTVSFCPVSAVVSDSVNIYTDSSSTVPLPDGRAGYKFLGWATSQSASEAEYMPGDTLTGTDANTTLYGVWARTVYTTTTSSYGYLMVAPTGVQEGSNITLAAYKDDSLVFVHCVEYTNGPIPFSVDVDYDTIKVFAWSAIDTMKPLCPAEMPDI